MSVLSAQSIRRLCAEVAGQNYWRRNYGVRSLGPLITPYVERQVINGKSVGLSACTYDCRIAQSLELLPGKAALASTIEQFNIPIDVCGSVLDKSSYARVFVSAFNTHLDPGWHAAKGTNHLTLELVNLGPEVAIYEKGDAVCQVKFEWLDEPTDLPYQGKYQSQPDRPVEVRHES